MSDANFGPATQPIQDQLIEFKLFYQANDNNVYHVTCKQILQDYPQGSGNSVSWEDDYDFEFFFQIPNNSTIIFHVTCKLLSFSLMVNLLNNKFYGMDFDLNVLKCRYFLPIHQKLSLEQSLKQILPLFFLQNIPDNEAQGNIENNTFSLTTQQ
ncbi:hypothetical protein C1645_787371 [Glomus cerebriforme]|uniref:Uncharacterized protein n=1 Tax=Glomus cerebriforme TaxID=658196 RepID=A0A397S9E5_9GLOM|nr:hypothetical protein C1645_787371 [Glomus cerebriforme]